MSISATHVWVVVIVVGCLVAKVAATSLTEEQQDGLPITKKDRIRGAMFGALVADAMCLGSHYEYDATKIRQAYGSAILPKYMAPGEQMGGETHGVGWGARNYHPGTIAGDQTDYGEYNVLILEHLAKLSNIKKNNGGDDEEQEFTVQGLIPHWKARITQGWKQWTCTQTKTTYQQIFQQRMSLDKVGGNSNAMALRSAPLFAISDDEETVVEYAKRAMFTHRERTAQLGNEFFARLTFRCIHQPDNQSLEDIVDSVVKDMNEPWISQKVQQAKSKVAEATDPSTDLSKEEYVDDLALTSMARLWDVGKSEPIKVGKASPTEGTLPGALYFILKYQNDEPLKAFQANAMVGGDNASRSIAIGMVLGARNGIRYIENHDVWGKDKLNYWNYTDDLMNKLPLLVESIPVSSMDEL